MVEETAAAVDAGGAGGDGGDGAGGGVDLADYRLKVHTKCGQSIKYVQLPNTSKY